MSRIVSRVRRIAYVVAALTLVACGDDMVQPTTAALRDTPRDKPRTTLAASPSDMSDGHGTAWRQLTETLGLTWTQVAALCPRDGVSPCVGNVGATSLAGWVWATDEQVVQLIGTYEPAILTSRLLSGTAYDAGVARFFTAFRASNAGGCFGSGYIVSCSFGQHVSGWTATSNSYGTAVSATIQSGFFAPTQISIVDDAAINSPISTRGIFLWRPDGSGGTGIVAHDDDGHIDSPNTGVVVPSVLVNDSLAGATATLNAVTLTQLSSTSTALSLNTADGSVSVTAGLRVGSESLRYRVCETARPSNCEAATVHISINGNIVDANDDYGAAKTGGGLAIANVLSNDTFAGAVATTAAVTLNATSSDPALSLSAGGAVTVASGASAGSHRITYEICEAGNAINCDHAAITVTVSNYAIDAVYDQGSAPSSRGGVAVANVLSNDTFNGVPATLALVSLSQVTAPGAGVSFNPADGSVRVAPNTLGGTQSFTYRICELAYPTNCDEASVTIVIAPQVYVMTKDRQRVTEGSGGSFTVALGQQPNDNVTVTVSYLVGGMVVTPSPSTLTFTTANWNKAQTVSFTTGKDSDKNDNAGTLQLSAPGITPSVVVISGTDTDRKGNAPVVNWTSLYNGQTVSGNVALVATGTSSAGGLVDAKFYDETSRIAIAPNAGGTFRSSWNSAALANGWHTLEVRISDTAGNETRSQIKVFVNN